VLHFDGTWASNKVLDPRYSEQRTSEVKYIIHPKYFVRASKFNPVIVIELVREGRPIATAKLKLFKEDKYINVSRPGPEMMKRKN